MSWRNESKNGFTIDLGMDTSQVDKNLFDWLEQQVAQSAETWLLAHAENGVIWGKVRDGKLTEAAQVDSCSPQLSSTTLLEARLFNLESEIHLWRTDAGWQACRITDKPNSGDAFDEQHRLWGVRLDTDKARRLEWNRDSDGKQNGFTLLIEPGVGIAHTVPIELSNEDFDRRGEFDTYRPLILTCRHYLRYDEQTGEAQIAASRLVNLVVEPFAQFEQRRNR
ncbi:MAG: CRISPR-associated protein Csx19 [Caldilineaceae bacterium]